MATGPVAVIGAGPAGLAAAAALRHHGIPALVLEQAGTVGARWAGHYERLHLHTVRWLSHLPGYRIPRREGRWVSRAGVQRYLHRYAAHHRLDVRTGTRVERVERDDGEWVLRAGARTVRAPVVVVATGHNHTPLVPAWAEAFTGRLVLARDYRTGAPHRGADVLVVGGGNTGAEIAVDLAEHGAARVRLAVRRPPYLLRRSRFGVPTQLLAVLVRRLPDAVGDQLAEVVRRLTVPDLSAHGWPRAGRGVFRRARDGTIPVLDVGLIDALRSGRVQPVAAVVSAHGPTLRLADGTAARPDVVVLATGYDGALTGLVGHLGVLTDTGRPAVHGARTHPAAPDLYFLGYTTPLSGVLREIGLDARRIARAVRRTWPATAAAHRPGA